MLAAGSAYHQVWARDSRIRGLGLEVISHPEGRAIFNRSLYTLRRFPSPLRKIPHNVGRTNVAGPALAAEGEALTVESGA